MQTYGGAKGAEGAKGVKLRGAKLLAPLLMPFAKIRAPKVPKVPKAPNYGRQDTGAYGRRFLGAYRVAPSPRRPFSAGLAPFRLRP